MQRVPGEGEAEPKAGPQFRVSELVIGLALLALAAAIVLDALKLPAGTLYGIGPEVAPMIVASGLTLLGLATVMAAWRSAPEASATVDAAPVLVMLGGIGILIAVLAFGGGFIAGFTAVFAATAWAFGNRAPHWDVAIGFALSLAIYLAFTKLLTLSLPEGPLERLL